MQQQIITPSRRPVRRYNREDLERIERRECAYRIAGRTMGNGNPVGEPIVSAPSLTAAAFDFDPRKGIRFGTVPKATGTTPPAVTLAGTRDRTESQLLSGGIKFTVLSGGTTMDVSFDNGATTIASAVTIPTGSTYSPPSPNNDLTFSFPSGTYNAGVTYEVAVEQWTDQIGGYTALNTTNTAQQPRYFVTGLSSLPYLDFDGTDDRLIGTSASVYNIWQDAAAFTLFQRIASDTPNAIRVAFSVGNSTQVTNSSRRFGTNAVGGGSANSTFNNDAGTAVVGDAASAMGTGARIHEWWSSGTTLNLAIDGVNDATIAGLACNPGTLTPNRFGFGCRASSTPTTFWDGKVGRHVGFNSNISDRAAWRAAL